jgi:hypothetical protein
VRAADHRPQSREEASWNLVHVADRAGPLDVCGAWHDKSIPSRAFLTPPCVGPHERLSSPALSGSSPVAGDQKRSRIGG